MAQNATLWHGLGTDFVRPTLKLVQWLVFQLLSLQPGCVDDNLCSFVKRFCKTKARKKTSVPSLPRFRWRGPLPGHSRRYY